MTKDLPYIDKKRLPPTLVYLIIAICSTPFILNTLGIDFSSSSITLSEQSPASLNDPHYQLSGAFTHTLLEWSAFCVAVITAIFAVVHYRVNKEVTIPVISIALFCAGSMDAFHTLAADRLIASVAENNKLIPFTWAISRTFNALIIIFGVSLFFIRPKTSQKAGLGFIISVSLVFILIAFIVIHYCANSSNLPVTIFPDAWITRPWDVGPLILYCISGLTLLRKFNKRYPSYFSHALLLSMIPEIFVECHMAFGSQALYDNDFNIAHFLKIIAYIVPAIGLMYEYIHTYITLEQTKQDLLEEKTKATAILDSAIGGVITINKKGQIQSFNHAAENIFGYKAEEVINKNVNILMPSPEHENHDNYLQNYLTTKEKKLITIRREVRGLRKTGVIFPLELDLTEVQLTKETIFTGFVHDISRRKALENELKNREQLFSTFVNAAPIMMWMLDRNNKPLLFNDTWLAFTNHSLEQEITCSWTGNHIHQNDRTRVIKEYNHALAQHQKFDIEYRLQRYDGEYRWLREIGIPYYENNNIYQGFIGICLDITQQKNTDQTLRHYTKDLERSNAELEQFAYIASHDLQEPLRMVSSYTQLLARRYQDKLDDDANEFIAFAVDGANRMQVLIEDLLTFSRVGKRTQTLTSIKTRQILDSVLINLKLSISESGSQINIKEPLPEIMADASQLQQLFQNLISNAIKYRSQDRSCIITISCIKNNNKWTFSIEDNGIGIEAIYFERIFEIFQRLHGKQTYTGTGIGLAVCKRIVESHGGTIGLTSTPNEGSTFFFSLPCLAKDLD